MSDYEIFEINHVKTENSHVKTFYFNTEMEAVPGQFAMLWIPDKGERPFTISSTKPLGLSISSVGEFTNYLHKYKGKVGIRGPYGNGYKINKGKNLIIGGGYGVASLAFLASLLDPSETHVIIGAKTKEELLFVDRFNSLGIEVLLATDDGSCGKHGFCTEILSELLPEHQYSMIYSCGPEKMLEAIVEITSKYHTKYQLNLERFMKCAVGLCGACTLGGFQVCSEGPIFTDEQISLLKEFGKSKHNKSGREIPI